MSDEITAGSLGFGNTFIDPTSPDGLIEITYAVLIGYCLYAAVFYFMSRRAVALVSINKTPWIDTAWYLVLIALSNGTSSIFFFFFFFSILIAAFRSGFEEGLRITFAASFLFSIIGYATAPDGQAFELNRFLIRPIYLMMLGYMISYWSGQEIKHKRHLVLLKDVNRLSNPRFGIDRTLHDIINRLRAFYTAESCLLITFDSASDVYNWRESSADGGNLQTEQSETAGPLIEIPGNLAIFHQNNSKYWCLPSNSHAFDLSTGSEVEIARETCVVLSDLLEAESFLTVPVFRGETLIGRLYLTSRENCFGRSEVEFLNQLVEQVLKAVGNVELLNRLASGAADHERQTISRDLHDSTIQPYIGLKLGLEALEIKHAAGAEIKDDIEILLKLTDSTIADLRGYVSTLKSETDGFEGSVLTQAVKQQAVKFKEFYDINISVEADNDFHLNDRLAAEAFQIISEGLSNIKRHSKAGNGTIRIYRDGDKLFLEIENDAANSGKNSEFVPKSIAGPAESLGGSARVEKLADRTKVLVEIPL